MSTAQPLFFVGRKANHFFTQVEYVEELEQHRYTAYWGGEPFVSFLEKDQREVRNTLAVGLVAGGMRQSDVAEVLGLTRRQTARYVHGETSLTDGPGRPPLVTDEIRAFVRERYRELCAAGPRRWRKRVSELVLEKFHVRLQLPTLSALVADLSAPAAGPREQAPTNEQEQGDQSAEPAEASEPAPTSEQEQGDQSAEPAEASEPPAYRESPAEDVDSSRVVRFEPPADPTECAAACQPAASIVVDNEFGDPNRELVERLLRTGVYSRYAAALVLNPFVARLLQSVVEAERPSGSATRFSVESYLLTFLQMNTFGCNNYESIQQLHPEEFGPIIGLERSPSLATLYRMTPEVLDALDPVKLAGAIAGNYLEQLAIGARLFYVDGHVQRYFGAANLLRTFHPQTRQSQRSYVQYVLSAQDGAPVLMVDGDASVPFQDHIVVLVQQLLRLTPAELVPSVVFDRGGYDRKLLSRFGGAEPSADQLAAHYVSWEVGDRTDYSTHPLDWQEVIIELQGNDLEHPRRQRLMVAEAPAEVRRGIWTKDSPLQDHRRLIVRQDYQREDELRSICTPFCTSDQETPAAELIAQLTLRWRQENVFKMVDADYGFDQISTYHTEPYDRQNLEAIPPFLQELLASRTFDNPQRRRLQARCRAIEQEMGRISDRLERVRRGEQLRQDRSKLRLPNDEAELSHLYDERLEGLHRLQAARLLLPGQINRLDYLAENGYERLDFSKKWVLDILRGAAHNARRQALNTWMTVYPNWRDYSQRFRDLLNLGGVLRLKGNTLQVTLKTMQQQRYQEAAEAFVAKIDRLSPVTFGGAVHPIRFTFRDQPHL